MCKLDGVTQAVRPPRVTFGGRCIYCLERGCEDPGCLYRYAQSQWMVCSDCDGVGFLSEEMGHDGRPCGCFFGVEEAIPSDVVNRSGVRPRRLDRAGICGWCGQRGCRSELCREVHEALMRREKHHTEEELYEMIKRLEVFRQSAIERETTMIRLKQEINNLCVELGRDPRYDLTFMTE